MNKFALLHIPDSAYCFPVSDKEIVIRLRTAKNDIKEAFIIFESKYKIGESQQRLPMKKALSGALFDYYSIRLKLEDTRLAYVFYLNDGEDWFFFSEDGATADYDYTKGYYNFFQYPYINDADILPKIDWLSHAQFYQIFIDRFNIGNSEKDTSYINLKWGEIPGTKSFAGGDLKGITEKLDYIKGLGCNALYLTPIFKSPSNHKYDISDYFEVDPAFGSAEDLHELIDSLHKRGMKIVLDAVFNHVSETNDKFRDVLEKGRASEYFDWFIINGDLPRKSPRNYEVFAECSYMPKWNTSNPEVQKYLISIALHYIREFGIDGWRLDVSDEISHDFWRRFRKEVKAAAPDAAIIGENWHDASNYLRGDQYDSIMNYAFTKCALDYIAHGKITAVGASDKFNDILARNTDTVNSMMMNLLDSHDTDRFYSETGEDKEKLHAALCLLYLFPGSPSIFYGTEVYTPGGYDPDCRRCMDWEAAQRAQHPKVMELISKLSEVRNRCRFVYEGTRIHASEDGNVLCVLRHGENADAVLYINQSNSASVVDGIELKSGEYKLYVDGGIVL